MTVLLHEIQRCNGRPRRRTRHVLCLCNMNYVLNSLMEHQTRKIREVLIFGVSKTHFTGFVELFVSDGRTHRQGRRRSFPICTILQMPYKESITAIL
jgi:hypothetical protein